MAKRHHSKLPIVKILIGLLVAYVIYNMFVVRERFDLVKDFVPMIGYFAGALLVIFLLVSVYNFFTGGSTSETGSTLM